MAGSKAKTVRLPSPDHCWLKIKPGCGLVGASRIFIVAGFFTNPFGSKKCGSRQTNWVFVMFPNFRGEKITHIWVVSPPSCLYVPFFGGFSPSSPLRGGWLGLSCALPETKHSHSWWENRPKLPPNFGKFINNSNHQFSGVNPSWTGWLMRFQGTPKHTKIGRKLLFLVQKSG